MDKPLLKSSQAQAWSVAIILAASTLGLTAPAHAAGFKQISRLGTSQAVCKPAIHTGDELQAFFRDQPQDVIDILRSGGWDGDANDLFNAVEAGNFSEQNYDPGTQLAWMGFRGKGGIVAEPREWAGKFAFEAFEVNVVSNCKSHQIVVPKACCNVSFLASTDIISSPPDIQVSQSGEQGETVNISVVSSDGTAVVTELTHPNGTSQQLTMDHDRWSDVLTPGDYMVTARATNSCGEATASQLFTVTDMPVAAMIPAPPKGGLYLAPFIGRQVRDIDPPLVGIDIGYSKPVAEKVAVFIQAGASFNTSDKRTSTYIDVGVDREIGQSGGFIGAGIGTWDITDSEFADETIFIHGGANTPWSISGNPVQWFVEGRIFADHTDDVGSHNILKAGLRIRP